MIRKTVAEFKTKTLDFNLSNARVTKDAKGECIIEGYANTSSKDRVGDVVLPKAFEKTLATYMNNPVLLSNHDWNDPCGVVLEAEITDKGLWIKARISDTREDVKTLIREGCLRTFSIGYNEVDADYDESTKTKYIKELELLEISVVTVPANTEAMFTQAATKVDSEGTEKTDDSAKSAPSVRTAKELADFIVIVKSVVNRELDSTETVAVCDYFNNEKEDIMTKEQLIQALKGKSLEVATNPVEAKMDEQQPAQQPAEHADFIKEIMAKLDAIGQALAQVLEAQKPQEPKEEPAEEPKKEEEPKEEAKMDEAEESEEEELSEEEVEKQIAEIEAEIVAIEDSENN